jgi:hypothetical protein
MSTNQDIQDVTANLMSRTRKQHEQNPSSSWTWDKQAREQRKNAGSKIVETQTVSKLVEFLQGIASAMRQQGLTDNQINAELSVAGYEIVRAAIGQIHAARGDQGLAKNTLNKLFDVWNATAGAEAGTRDAARARQALTTPAIEISLEAPTGAQA